MENILIAIILAVGAGLIIDISRKLNDTYGIKDFLESKEARKYVYIVILLVVVYIIYVVLSMQSQNNVV